MFKGSFQLQAGEKVIYRAPFHFITDVPIYLKGLVGLAILAIFTYFFPQYSIYHSVGRLIVGAICILILIYVITKLHESSLNFLTVTNARLISSRCDGLFHKSLIEMPYDRIENIYSKVQGFWGSVMDFGTLRIRTAGEEGEIEMGKYFPHPLKIQGIVSKAREDFLKNNSMTKFAQNEANKDLSDMNPQSFAALFQKLLPLINNNRNITENPSPTGFQVSSVEQPLISDGHKIKKPSYLVEALLKNSDFKSTILKELNSDMTDETEKGQRLVKVVTGNPEFKELILNELLQNSKK